MSAIRGVVSETAIRELLREALHNVGAQPVDDTMDPVVTNSVVDRPSIQIDVDPIEIKHLPRTRNELVVMVRNMLDDVPDDQSGELYKKIKDAFATTHVQSATTRANEQETDRMETANDKIASLVKEIVQEELAKHRSLREDKDSSRKDLEKISTAVLSPDPDVKDDDDVSWSFDDSDEDIEAEIAAARAEEAKAKLDSEDDEPEPGEKRPSQRVKVDDGSDGMTLEKIGEEFGFTKEAAKRAVETAMERFQALWHMDVDKRNLMVLNAVGDYINELAETGELTDEEEELMRRHPRIVADGEGFREYFGPYVKKLVRDKRADTQDLE